MDFDYTLFTNGAGWTLNEDDALVFTLQKTCFNTSYILANGQSNWITMYPGGCLHLYLARSACDPTHCRTMYTHYSFQSLVFPLEIPHQVSIHNWIAAQKMLLKYLRTVWFCHYTVCTITMNFNKPCVGVSSETSTTWKNEFSWSYFNCVKETV